MENLILSIPTLFGDHHVTAVRTILEALPGVSEVYVSASSKQVALQYDPKSAKPAEIESALAEQGYASGDEEPVYAVSVDREPTRHSAAMEAAGAAMTFQETAPSWQGRPLWPCPGMEYQPIVEEETA